MVTDKKQFFRKTGRGYIAEDEFEENFTEFGHWGDEDYDDSWQDEGSIRAKQSFLKKSRTKPTQQL